MQATERGAFFFPSSDGHEPLISSDEEARGARFYVLAGNHGLPRAQGGARGPLSRQKLSSGGNLQPLIKARTGCQRGGGDWGFALLEIIQECLSTKTPTGLCKSWKRGALRRGGCRVLAGYPAVRWNRRRRSIRFLSGLSLLHKVEKADYKKAPGVTRLLGPATASWTGTALSADGYTGRGLFNAFKAVYVRKKLVKAL